MTTPTASVRGEFLELTTQRLELRWLVLKVTT